MGSYPKLAIKRNILNTLLWVLQILFGLYFVGIGLSHFIVPEGLPAMMAWMYELSSGLHFFSGTAEILGGLGLIMPGLTKKMPKLTIFAAEGLALVMLGALVWHFQRGEFSNMGFNIFLILVMSFIAYGRWKLSPLKE